LGKLVTKPWLCGAEARTPHAISQLAIIRDAFPNMTADDLAYALSHLARRPRVRPGRDMEQEATQRFELLRALVSTWPKLELGQWALEIYIRRSPWAFDEVVADVDRLRSIVGLFSTGSPMLFRNDKLAHVAYIGSGTAMSSMLIRVLREVSVFLVPKDWGRISRGVLESAEYNIMMGLMPTELMAEYGKDAGFYHSLLDAPLASVPPAWPQHARHLPESQIVPLLAAAKTYGVPRCVHRALLLLDCDVPITVQHLADAGWRTFDTPAAVMDWHEQRDDAFWKANKGKRFQSLAALTAAGSAHPVTVHEMVAKQLPTRAEVTGSGLWV
jgi:hypothetical protein